MSFIALLAIVFITLKLVGVIAWSWWLVLLPLYGPALLIVFAALFGFSVFTAFRVRRKTNRRAK